MNLYMNDINHYATEGLFEAGIKSWHEWDMNP